MSTETAIVLENGTYQVTTLPVGAVTHQSRGLLVRMFADPHLLEPGERGDLVAQLRQAVEDHPEISELRVLLGMAMCVNFEVQPAIEELRTAVQLAPESFIAHLKMGELWMRLRVMDKADEHTKRAGLLARNRAQTELARRQAATIRTIRQQGVERGGYKSLLSLGRLRRMFTPKRSVPALSGLERPAEG